MRFEERKALPQEETPTSHENAPQKETSVEQAEQIYAHEIAPILDALKPEVVSSEEYAASVMDDLMGEVKNIQVINGKLVADPVDTMREVKNLLNRKIKKIVLDAKDNSNGRFKKPKISDRGLLRRAKLALLVQNDFSDIGEYAYKHREYTDTETLKRYISGYSDDDPCLSESELETLMRTPFRQSLVNHRSSSDYFGPSYSKGDYVKKLPESLMIALTQNQKREHGSTGVGGAILERALWQYAEDGKYGHDLVDHLLASHRGDLITQYPEKFSGDITEKVIRAGEWDMRRIIDFLLKKNLRPDEFRRYTDCFVKNNKLYDLVADRRYSKKGEKVVYESQDLKRSVELPYENVIDECRKLEKLNTDEDLKTDEERDALVESLIQDGYVGFLIYRDSIRPSLQGYSERHYSAFLQAIVRNNQEHLVLPLLTFPDIEGYTQKLIAQGEEYMIVRHLRSLPDGFVFNKNTFDSLKKKNLTLNLGAGLERFRGLNDEDALLYIENEQIELFLEHFSSFSPSKEFLHRSDIQKQCLEIFREYVFSGGGHDLNRATKIFERIPLPRKEVDEMLMNALRLYLKDENCNVPHGIVQAFPHSRKLLETEEFQNLAQNMISKVQHITELSKILETVPLPNGFLQSRETREHFMSIIRSNIPFGSNIFPGVYTYCDEVMRIARFVPLPLDAQRIRAVIEEIEKLPESAVIRQDYARRICGSEDSEQDLKKMLALQAEFKNNKSIADNEKFLLLYIARFIDGGTQEEKEVFAERIMHDISLLSKNRPIDSENKEYYEGLLREVYQQRNYDTYKYLDQYEDRSQDLASYKFDGGGYAFRLSGLVGYRVKEGASSDDALITEFSSRIAAIKNIAASESLSQYVTQEVPHSKAQTLEGKILDYFRVKGYTVDTMNVLLAYQLLGSYDNFVSASSDRVSLEESQASKNYILLDELVNQYGDNMKETIKAIQEKVAQSEDRELFSAVFREKYEKKYAEALTIIAKDLAKIPREKISDATLQKKIVKTIKNVFQGTPEIQKLAEEFSQLFSVNDFDTLGEVWNKHINQLLVVDEGGRIDTEKVESLQSAVYTRLQNEIGKYEEIKEVDEKKKRTEEKLSKERTIKGYFSKNRENAHARMVGDICLAGDPNMLKNPKYFELVLFDEERTKCVGTTMLLEMDEPKGEKKYLLYCPNPSVGLVSEVSAKRLYQMLTRQVTRFASDNGFDALLVDKKHGRSTNRAGLFQQSLEQSCLKDKAGKERLVSLTDSHTLGGGYTYQNDLQLVWER